MSHSTEPDTLGPRNINQRESRFSRIVMGALAVLWLLLPAVQYLGALERTELVLGRADTPGALSGADLSPWYVLLLGVTLLYAAVRAVRGREPEDAG